MNSNLSSPPNVWLGSGWLHSTLKAMPVSVALDMSPMAHLASHRGIKGGGGLVWIRSGLELFYNPGYGDTLFQNNLVAWRVESRLAFNVPRPSAVCLVSNLPTS
jgi:hypothetical protein